MRSAPKCFDCSAHVEDAAHGRGERKRHECHYTGEKKSLKRIEMIPSPKWCPKRTESNNENPIENVMRETPVKANGSQPSLKPSEKMISTESQSDLSTQDPMSPVGDPPAPKEVNYEYKVQCYSQSRCEYLNVGPSQPIHNPGTARERLSDWKRRFHRIYANNYDSKDFDINRTRIIKRKKTVSYGEWEEVE